MDTNIISGLQKLTLLDYPGKVACTLFTKGCNMRCPFCHNAALVTRASEQPLYSNDEILSFLKKRVGILDGVCITGGEPTLMKGLDEFIAEIKKFGYCVKLDTNGTRPEVLKSLIEQKLVDYVAMDIKNSPEKYGETIGLGADFDITPIMKSVSILMENDVDFEFRTTVADPLHTSEDIQKIGEWLRGEENFYLQQFKDSGDIIGSGIRAYDKDQMTNYVNILKRFVPNAQLRGL